MHRAMQAILIAGKKQRDDVLHNVKRITIREGHRDYSPGSAMLGCHILNWAIIRKIISVEHQLLADVTEQEYKDDGFNTLFELADGLRKYYPDISLNSPVTIVRWE